MEPDHFTNLVRYWKFVKNRTWTENRTEPKTEYSTGYIYINKIKIINFIIITIITNI